MADIFQQCPAYKMPLSITHKCKCVRVLFCLSLCDPGDSSPPGSSVQGISQARIVEWVAISFSRDFPDPGIEPVSPAAAGGFSTTAATCEVNIDQCVLNLDVDHN